MGREPVQGGGGGGGGGKTSPKELILCQNLKAEMPHVAFSLQLVKFNL